MPSTIDDVLFSAPSGRPKTVVQFAGAVLFLGLYAYAAVGGDAASNGWLLVMAVGSALSGLAESLPKRRRRLAGLLRLTAILALTGLLAGTVLAPELVFG